MLRKYQYIFIGILLIASQCLAQNRQKIDSLKLAIRNADQDTSKIILLTQLANQYGNIYHDSSVLYSKQALDVAREINDFDKKAMVLTRLGSGYCFKGEYLKSLEYLDLAENILKEYPNKIEQANIFYLKSVVFISIDRFNQASEFALDALELYKELNNIRQIGSVYSVLCNVYEELGNKAQSLEYARMAYGTAIQVNDSIDISGKLNNLATLYYNIGKTDSAYYFLHQAIRINKRFNVKTWLGINYQNLADYLLAEGKLDSANYYIEKVLAICDETGYRLNYFPAIEVKAKIALAAKDTLQAIEIYKSIIQSSKDLESLKSKVNAYKALVNIAKNQGRIYDAFEYQQQYKIFDDSLSNQNNTNLMTLLEMQMEYEKQHSQLELENKEVKLKSQRKNFFIAILGSLILFLGITFYFIYRLQKSRAERIHLEKQKVEEQLESQNREMAANVMSLLKKNEMLTDISKKLLETKKHAVKDETKNALKSISKELQKIKDHELWEEFDIRFRQVHNDFYSSLLSQAPNLSPGEQRMCAFLRMNMSTKDISDLTNLEPHSIDNTRYNIRKKLGIDSKTNLVTYLSKI